MVKIINGEIVPDDDPRAQRFTQQQQRNNQPFPNAWQRAGNQGNQAQPNRQQQQQQQQQPSPLTEINNRLRGFGINDVNIQGNVIEPIFLVAAVLALVFYGFPGLLIVAVVWFLTTRQR
ncbi:protein FAM241B-like [Clytia hemisphaerica]|uniref:protein FAM241B-like n=1 Tax=Clytia hemisphaerica TaxID=252671 RepID=UPI0034D76E3D